MTRTTREDMVVISMGIDALLESVRQTETWWQAVGDKGALRRTQLLSDAILATRRKFFAEDKDSEVRIAEARAIAEGLRDAARQCHEGQEALHARLLVGAQMIERLCHSREVRP